MVNSVLGRDRGREVFAALAHEAGVAPTKANYDRWCTVQRRLADKPPLLTAAQVNQLIRSNQLVFQAYGDLSVAFASATTAVQALADLLRPGDGT